MSNLQEQGRAHYKRGDYRKAIELFDKAIGRAASVQLLDNRAACYEKLKELPSALQDAKKTIQLHREDATGYLRAGKVLMKMEKPRVALDIYTHGLKCIKHVGQGYDLLKKVHKEVLDIVSPPKSVDPLTVLPRELAETILQYLSFRQRMNACLVSPGWARFIRSCPNLWAHLDLSGAKKKVRTAFISRAINVGRSKLRKASLSMLFDFDKSIIALVKHCPLEELDLLEVPLQGTNLQKALELAKSLKAFRIKADPDQRRILDPELLLQTVSGRIETFWGTVGVYLRDGKIYDRLSELKIVARDSYHFSHCLANIAERMPNIQSLAIQQIMQSSTSMPRPADLSSCTKLSYLELVGGPRELTYLGLPSSLVALKLTDHMPSESPLPLQYVWNRTAVHDLPRLEELTVVAPWVLYANSLRPLLERCENGNYVPSSEARSTLRRLTLSCHMIEEAFISTALDHPRLRHIECISFAGCDGMNDDCVATIVGNLPELRSLDLTACNITGVGVKAAAKAKFLEHLVLNDCRSLSADAVVWAREKGIKVEYKMKSERGGGLKVRY